MRAKFVVSHNDAGEEVLAEIPRPEHLGMWRVVPTRRIEFWQNGEHRLHTRTAYEPIVVAEGEAERQWKTFMMQP